MSDWVVVGEASGRVEVKESAASGAKGEVVLVEWVRSASALASRVGLLSAWRWYWANKLPMRLWGRDGSVEARLLAKGALLKDARRVGGTGGNEMLERIGDERVWRVGENEKLWLG